jgi:hypothetical protein
VKQATVALDLADDHWKVAKIEGGAILTADTEFGEVDKTRQGTLNRPAPRLS